MPTLTNNSHLDVEVVDERGSVKSVLSGQSRSVRGGVTYEIYTKDGRRIGTVTVPEGADVEITSSGRVRIRR